MKLKFAYLYLSFIVSLIILVTLTALFYNRLKKQVNYTGSINNTYNVVLTLRELEENMTRVESSSRGYLLIRDSSFLKEFNMSRDSVHLLLDSLNTMINDDSDQMRRFLLMRSTALHHLKIVNRLLESDTNVIDENDAVNILRSKSLMQAFYDEANQIAKGERRLMEEQLREKEFSETFYPNYFNSILIWTGIITLVSFYFINREVKIRAKYQSELEKRLHELNTSNSELRQFAYIASHDLQEPLRKIRTFTDKFFYRHQDSLSDEMKLLIGRIEKSAKRMQELIQDMQVFTTLINKEEVMSVVNLNEIVANVLADFSELSKERHAIITWDRLPEITGNAEQLSLLFRSLIDNAFKFAKTGESPMIRITYKLIDGSHPDDEVVKGKNYHKIVMEDKGIGFNNEFAEKIFMIFQRLHTQQSGYRGKGIGLAIAQRIMTNHNGVILARGMINDGATFIMYFPVEK